MTASFDSLRIGALEQLANKALKLTSLASRGGLGSQLNAVLCRRSTSR
jgi:hypothetical protein